MSSGEILGLACLVAIVLAVWLGRRKGRANAAAAYAAAKAEGRAELQAELASAASAVAHGGSVVVQLGNGQLVTAEHGRDDDHHFVHNDYFDDAAATDYIRGGGDFRRLHPVRDGGRIVGWRVGELLGGVQHGQAAPDGDAGAVPGGVDPVRVVPQLLPTPVAAQPVEPR